jgi:hypothetical protein
MKPEIAKAAIAFLNRIDLKGNEVPAFSAVVMALNELANKKPEIEHIDKTKGKK